MYTEFIFSKEESRSQGTQYGCRLLGYVYF